MLSQNSVLRLRQVIDLLAYMHLLVPETFNFVKDHKIFTVAKEKSSSVFHVVWQVEVKEIMTVTVFGYLIGIYRIFFYDFISPFSPLF